MENEQPRLNTAEGQNGQRPAVKWPIIVVAPIVIFLCAVFVYAILPRQPDADVLDAASAMKKKHRVRSRYTIIIDYTLPAFAKRLWVLEDSSVVLNTWVTHARNSGIIYAREFSNIFGTNKSTIGSFVTVQRFPWQYERFGLTLATPAMRVRGMERRNSEAYRRGIYFHKTVFPIFWSWGCFATLPSDNDWLTQHCQNTFLYVRGTENN